MADDQRVGGGAAGHDRDRLRVHRPRRRDPCVRLAVAAGQVTQALRGHQPRRLQRSEIGIGRLTGEQRLRIGEQAGGGAQQRAVFRAGMDQVDVPVERVADLRRAPLEQLHQAAKRLVGGGKPGRAVRRGVERGAQPLLGRAHRRGRRRLAVGGGAQPAGQLARQFGGGGAQPVPRRWRREQQHRDGSGDGRHPPALKPVGNRGGAARGDDRQHVGEHGRDGAGRGVRADDPAEEDRERDGDRDERGEPGVFR